MIVMPSLDLIEDVLGDAHSHGMSVPGCLPAGFSTEPPWLQGFLRAAADIGLGMGRTVIAPRDEQGGLLPQNQAIHFLDLTAQVPPVVNEWILEMRGVRFDLCLIGATRLRWAIKEDMPTSLVAVFQVCGHGEDCPRRQKGDTRDIGFYDMSKGGQQRAGLDYTLLAVEKPGNPRTGICTLLSTKAWGGPTTAILVVNPNHIEREYSLDEEQLRPRHPHGGLRQVK